MKENQGRRGRPRLGRPPTGQNTMIGIRWSPDLINGIDQYASMQAVDRGTALREIVAKFLTRKGLLSKRNQASPGN